MKKIFTLKNLKLLLLELLIVVLFVLSRAPSLGHDNFNTDVWKWKARSYDFGTGIFSLNFEKTLQKYHPGVTLMWVGVAGVKIFNLYADITHQSIASGNTTFAAFGLDVVQKALLVFVLGLTLAFCFYPLQQLFGKRYAAFAITGIALEPLYIALTRVFHLEGMMSTFMIASAMWLFYFLNTKKYWHLILSGVFAGFAILTKTSALYLIPFAGLSIFLWNLDEHRNLFVTIKKLWVPFGIWLGLALATFVLFWPIMWVNPVEAIQTMYRGIAVIGVEGDHSQFYFDTYVTDPGVFYYFVVLAYRASILLLIGILGSAITYIQLKDKTLKKFVLFCFIFTFFYFIQLTLPSKKLDRYIIPAMLSLSLISSTFYFWLAGRIKFNKYAKYAMFLLLSAIPLVYLYPDYFSYYNPLLGGVSKGIHVIEPKWMIGATETVDYFDKLAAQDGSTRLYQDKSLEGMIASGEIAKTETIGFQEKYYTQIWPFFREKGMFAIISDLTPFAIHAKYFVYPVWDDTGATEVRFSVTKIGTIKVRGADVYNVYKRNN